MAEQKLAYGRAQLDRRDGDGPLDFIASTTAVNRFGFSLRNEGWRLDNYNRNPVFLWMHDKFQPPIGRSEGARTESGERLRLSGVTFDREDELARTIESKYRRGFLSAVSVGWGFVDAAGTPVEDWWRLSAERIASDEMFYDLEEVSAVTVPGDPTAVAAQSRDALARFGRELVDLFEEREHGSITKPELQAAVRAELDRLGIRPPDDPDPAPAGVDEAAAQAVLAAFAL